MQAQKDMSGWGAFHQDLAARQAAFCALPKKDREAAWRVVKAHKSHGEITVDEMLHAHKQMKEMN
jgi:hypothetical protein